MTADLLLALSTFLRKGSSESFEKRMGAAVGHEVWKSYSSKMPFTPHVEDRKLL